MSRVSVVLDVGIKGQEAASAYAEYMAAGAPHAADALKNMAPAALFAAPLVIVLAAAITQFHEMKKNKGRCEELGARLVALQGVLQELQTRNTHIATSYKALFERMTALVQEGATLMAKVEARGAIMSYFAAGADGAKLDSLRVQLADWIGTLTAAIVAGVEPAMRDRVKTEVASSTARAISAIEAAATDAQERSRATLHAARVVHDAVGNVQAAVDRVRADVRDVPANVQAVVDCVRTDVLETKDALEAYRMEMRTQLHGIRADAVSLRESLLARLDDSKTVLDTIVREAREHHRENMNANDQLQAMLRVLAHEVHGVRAAIGGSFDGGSTDAIATRVIPLSALTIDWGAPLGAGNYGAVYKAVWSHAGDTRDVAVKFFFTEGCLSPEERAKVLREVGVLARLGNAHPNVIQVCRRRGPAAVILFVARIYSFQTLVASSVPVSFCISPIYPQRARCCNAGARRRR